MRTPLKMSLAAALPLASLLWMTPPAVADDGYRSHAHRRSWAESYRNPRAGRYTEAERYRGYHSSREYGKINGNTTRR